MKKTVLLTLITVMTAVTMYAQQVPMVSHYYFNRFLYNPANTGLEDYGQAYLLYRNQWNNIEGAPRTTAFTLDGPLRNNKAGLGISLFQDRAGQFNSTGGQIAYRYGLQLNKEHALHFGIALGFLDNRIDFGNLLAKHTQDPLIMNPYQPATGFDANFGVTYTYDKLAIGFSVPQVIANDLVYRNITALADVEYGMVRHYIATARYDFDLTDKLSFEPIAMVRATPGAPTQFDINAMFNYDDKFWLGGMYRSAYAATFSAATKLFDQVVAGYSYDLVTNTDRQYMNGAHEVMLGYHFGGSPADDPNIKKRFKEVDDKLKKDREDIDKNREDIDDNKENIEKNKEDIEDTNEKIDEEVEKLRNDFEAFKKKVEAGEIKAGDAFSFNNVYFETNRWDIKGVNLTELNNMANILYKNPTMKIAVAGHADVRGTESWNETLAQKRAESVKSYLVMKGISADRITVESYGEKVIADPTSYAPNRRVEFRVLSK
jgi:type IX secretion system PorP/SprF family membrane protein